ncbi:MAG TPA: hypothetical protein VFU21_06305 [Kofleriaceae bacterium]|jgi:hypothetical protein|nr:hypothetical protein [Kofleriaceae bacterium]
MTSSPKVQTPLLISLGLVAAGVIIAAIGGITAGSILGGVVAALGVVPACWGAWAGMQKETQASLGLAILLVFVSLGVGGLLLLLRVVDWLR